MTLKRTLMNYMRTMSEITTNNSLPIGLPPKQSNKRKQISSSSGSPSVKFGFKCHKKQCDRNSCMFDHGRETPQSRPQPEDDCRRWSRNKSFKAGQVFERARLRPLLKKQVVGPNKDRATENQFAKDTTTSTTELTKAQVFYEKRQEDKAIMTEAGSLGKDIVKACREGALNSLAHTEIRELREHILRTAFDRAANAKKAVFSSDAKPNRARSASPLSTNNRFAALEFIDSEQHDEIVRKQRLDRRQVNSDLNDCEDKLNLRESCRALKNGTVKKTALLEDSKIALQLADTKIALEKKACAGQIEIMDVKHDFDHKVKARDRESKIYKASNSGPYDSSLYFGATEKIGKPLRRMVKDARSKGFRPAGHSGLEHDSLPSNLGVKDWNDVVKEGDAVSGWKLCPEHIHNAPLAYWLKSKHFMAPRDPTVLIPVMVTDARNWMLGNGYKLESYRDYDIMVSAIRAAYSVDPLELWFRSAIKDTDELDHIAHVNKTARGDLGDVSMFSSASVSGKRSLANKLGFTKNLNYADTLVKPV